MPDENILKIKECQELPFAELRNLLLSFAGVQRRFMVKRSRRKDQSGLMTRLRFLSGIRTVTFCHNTWFLLELHGQ